MCVVNILNSVNSTLTVKIILNKGKQIWKPKGKLFDNSLNKTKQIWKPKGKLSDNSLNKTKQIWKPKGKLSDNSLKKTKQIWKPKGKLSDNSLKKTRQVWKATGKLFAKKKFALGELCTLTRLPVVQIILWYLDSGCSKLDLEESMAPVRISSGPVPVMMTSGQLKSGLAP
ncbi:hypothetical protein Tco_1027334, partial [Tanacetum coccineum]